MKRIMFVLVIVSAVCFAFSYVNAAQEEVATDQSMQVQENDPDAFSPEFLATFTKEFDAAWARISEEKKEKIDAMPKEKRMSYITDLVRKEVTKKLNMADDKFFMAMNQAEGLK